MSLVGKMMSAFMRRHFNVNPETCDDQVKKLRFLDKFNKFTTNRGYIIERFTTPKGTKYERAYRQESRFSGKAVLFLHGGAYIAGLTSGYRKMAKPFSVAAGGAEVFYLDYQCAPAARYPSQLNEALDMWEELTERLGYLPQNVIVGGDSAGGNLTLALLLALRDQGRSLPAAAFCWSPWADMTASGSSYFDNYQKDVMFGNRRHPMTPEIRDRLLSGDIYCFAASADRTSPYVSPVYGRYHDFPPMFFTVGGDEVLLSDTLTVAEKLRKEGIEADVDVQPHMFHDYTMYYGFLPEAKASFAKTLRFIQDHA